MPDNNTNEFFEKYIATRKAINECDIPERIKEILHNPRSQMTAVSKFIWESLTPADQFTCLVAFPDEMKLIMERWDK
ncbi:TPA: hypothetical protein QHB43_001179 [Aeromonas hydrophila subsp. hydrophila]|nr:hypothetical protein [Aeromonas hydrophila subsp. hydrophila]